jgi:hypothetical protein
MKRIIVATALCITGVARADVPTHPPTVAELVQVCSSVNVVTKATAANPPTQMQFWDAMYCMGYFAAVTSMNAAAICPPVGTPFDKSAEVFLRWVRTNPKVLEPPQHLAWSAVLTSLLNEGPCKQK